MPLKFRFRSLVTILLLLNGLLPPVSAQQQSPQDPPSLMEIPVQMSLSPLYRAAERAVPWQTGNWREWRNRHGIQTKYRAWRGPLAFRLQGEMLQVQAHVRYWIKARPKLLHTLGVEADCGVDEPPRQAIIGVMVRLRWTPDWSLRPEFRILPTRFLDRCEMTFADIDVTGIVAKVFQRQLQDNLRTAMRSLAPLLGQIRGQAQRTWSRLQEPIPLNDDGGWLLLQPVAAALSPVHGQDNSVGAELALLLRPRVSLGPRPEQNPRPLPLLHSFYPRAGGLAFDVSLNLDLAEIGRQLLHLSQGQEFEVKGHQIGIEGIELGGKNDELSAKIRLTGEMAGTAEVSAKLGFSVADQQLRLQQIDYLYDADDPAVGLLSELFYASVTEELQKIANRLLAEKLQSWKQRLTSTLAEAAPEETRLDMSSLRLSSATLQIGEKRIRIMGRVAGKATLTLH